MSQLARMFVVLNFLLAAGFLYSAAMFLGLNHEWKKKHTDVTAQLSEEKVASAKREATQKTRIDDLTRESQTVKETLSGLQGSEGRLREANTTAEKDKKEKDAAIAKEQGNVASANENLKRANDELAKRTDEANKLPLSSSPKMM